MAAGNEEKVIEDYVKLIAKNINPDIDPREDFMKYASGNFSLESYDQRRGEFPPNRFGDPFDKILENETLNYTSLVKARNFYKSYENDVGKLLRDGGLREFCGGFPAFGDNWTSANFDWIKATGILSAMNLHTIISYSIKYLDGKRNVEISVEIPDEDVTSSAAEILQKIGIESDKIAEIIKDVDAVKEMSQSQAPTGVETELRADFFNKFFEIATGSLLSEDDELQFDEYDVSYVKGLLNIFSEIDAKSVANYISCMAVYKHGESKIFTIPHELVMNYFSPAIVAAGFSEYWNPDEAKKREEVRKRYVNSFELCKDQFAVDCIKSKPAFMTQDNIVSDYIARNFPQDDVDQEYGSLEIVPDNFFQNIVNIVKLGPTTSLKKYFSDKSEDQDMQLQIISFLQDVVNTSRKPMIFHFSGWELEMWREVLHCCKLNTDTAEYRVLKDAISMQMITFDIPEDLELVKMCASTTEALKQAFEDYKTWLNDNQDIAEKQAQCLKKLNLTNNQAFFVAFVQHFCGADHLDPNVALLALSNSDEFAEEFGIKRTI